MAFAVGAIPNGTQRVTALEMTWKCSQKPAGSGLAFFSPWFGMDPADNLNLIQPVNPWSGLMSSDWGMYTEYYQWSPTHNSNSRRYAVQPGQTLHGKLEYTAATDSYLLSQTIVETGQTSEQNVTCQNGKKYTIPYVVYEKVNRCSEYPPDGKLDFTITRAECDFVDCINDIKWEAKVKDANCNFAAHINSQTSISLTWNTKGASAVDHLSDAQIAELNRSPGWANEAADAVLRHLQAQEQ